MRFFLFEDLKGFRRKSVSTRNFPKLPTLVTPDIYLFIFQRDMGCRSAVTLTFLLQNFAFAKNIFAFANFKYAFAKIIFAKAEK
jgi:hypothetical protein